MDGKLDPEAIGVISKEAQNPPTRAGHPVHPDYTTIVSIYSDDYAKVNMLIQWESYQVIVILRPPMIV